MYDDNRLNHKFRQGLSDHENAVAEFVNEFVIVLSMIDAIFFSFFFCI